MKDPVPPLVSVVLPSFNQARFLESALESLFEQDDPSLEVIVVDGGSGDGSADVIRRHASRLAWWVSEPDAGQSDALNKGFARTSGTWLSWLNSDDLLLPGALAQLRARAAAKPEALWFAGSGRFVDAGGRTIRSYAAPSRPLEAADLVPWTHTWFGQPGTFFRRELFDSVGGAVRTDLRYAMDLDLWLRFGAKTALEPIAAPLGAYRLHDASKTVAERHAMECEVVRVLWEHMGAEAAMRRVTLLSKDRYDLEARYLRLANDLKSPGGWLRLLRRRVRARSGEAAGA